MRYMLEVGTRARASEGVFGHYGDKRSGTVLTVSRYEYVRPHVD